MTINPSQFGFSTESVQYYWLTVPLPLVEAHQKWNDGDPPTDRYHRHRARAHVDYIAGDEIDFLYKLTYAASNDWTETAAVAGGVSDDWTSTWANANETQHHPDDDSSEAVPNETPDADSHRWIGAQIKWKEDSGNAGNPVINGFEIGWPNDTAIAAGEPDVELCDRTGAHQFDSYNNASAWHIATTLLGTIHRMQYESVWRISFAMANQR